MLEEFVNIKNILEECQQEASKRILVLEQEVKLDVWKDSYIT